MNTREAIRAGIERALIGLVEQQQRQAQKPKMRLLVDAKGVPMFHSVRDKLGDIMRVYRADPISCRHRPKYDGADLRAITAEKGVGRPRDVINRRMFRTLPLQLGKTAAATEYMLDRVRQDAEQPAFVSAVGGGVYFGELDIEAIQAAGPMQFALRTHGSQRAAARAIGIALSTFQRRLAKEQSGA